MDGWAPDWECEPETNPFIGRLSYLESELWQQSRQSLTNNSVVADNIYYKDLQLLSIIMQLLQGDNLMSTPL